MDLFRDMKIRVKLDIITAASMVLMGVIFLWVFEYNLAEGEKRLILDRISHVQQEMKQLEENDTRILAASLSAVISNNDLKKIFKSGDREGLYNTALPLFKELKEKGGITHFYFHLPDGKVFLRVHNKDMHGDVVTRHTFKQAAVSGKMTSGIELGMTAFALRVVAPYNDNNGRLLGYVELGQEIDHFLHILKGNSLDHFAMVADKSFLSRDDWRSVRRTAALPDNWDDLKEHLMVAGTSNEVRASGCYTEENVDFLEKGERYIGRFNWMKRGQGCGGFELKDVAGMHVGAVLVLVDVSARKDLMYKNRVQTVIIFIILSLATILSLNFFIRRYISTPIEDIAGTAKKMAKGDLDHGIEAHSRDEIGELAGSLNHMASELKGHINHLEEMVQERTEELNATNQELNATNQELNATNQELVATNEELQASYAQMEAMTTELEEANQKLEHLNEDIKGLERMKTEFLQTISHELRSPLTPILGYLELMRDGDVGEFSLKQKDVIDEMTICSKNMHMIVEEVLEVASLQAGRVLLQYDEFDIVSIIQASVNDVKRFAEGRKIIIDTVTPQGHLRLFGDSKKLKTVFIHIMRNAVKFSHDAGKITVRLSALSDGAQVVVTDRGIGIPKSKLDRIFDAFYQGDSSSTRHFEGVGLGLYLVKRLIDLHGGKIEVQSEEGTGTEIKVFVPDNFHRKGRVDA